MAYKSGKSHSTQEKQLDLWLAEVPSTIDEPCNAMINKETQQSVQIGMNGLKDVDQRILSDY